MSLRTLVTTLAFVALHVSGAEAQQAGDMRWTGRGTAIDTARAIRDASRFRVVSTRSLSALLGMVAGVYAGYQMGDSWTPVSEKQDGFGDRAMTGAVIGFFVGSAAGAALPSYQSRCSFQERFLRGLGGTVVGLIPSPVLGPIGPAVGAAAFQGRC